MSSAHRREYFRAYHARRMETDPQYVETRRERARKWNQADKVRRALAAIGRGDRNG